MLRGSVNARTARTHKKARLTEPAHPCTDEQFKYGQWVRGISACGLLSKFDFQLEENPLVLTLRPPENQTFNVFADYCWKPYNCTVKPFSVDEFCHKLGGRKILVVGDSTQHEFYVTIHMQLHTPYQPSIQTIVGDLNNDSSTSGRICEGKGGGRLEFIRSDQIGVTDVVPWNKPPQSKTVGLRDWKAIASHFDILVLNKGTHYKPIGASEKDTRATAAFLLDFLSEDPKRHVFYRTTPPGHPTCSPSLSRANETLLLSEPTWLPPLKSRDFKLFGLKYGYVHFPRINEQTVKILKEKLPPQQLTVLYVAEMTVLRPDGHRCERHTSTPWINCTNCDYIHRYLPSSVHEAWLHAMFNLFPAYPPDNE
eukprot:gene29669-35813_t